MLETAVSIDFNEVFSAELNRLNTSQQRAVETIEGPVLVIAGPGTGKTQIIAARIGYILSSEDTQARPQNIICLTYTDAGAIAMRKRLLKFIGPTAYRVDIFTFHAFL
jgi:DNA helicase-2/ATP-dependent DNA helicase PcrA